jgi:hypothetical protein
MGGMGAHLLELRIDLRNPLCTLRIERERAGRW